MDALPGERTPGGTADAAPGSDRTDGRAAPAPGGGRFAEERAVAVRAAQEAGALLRAGFTGDVGVRAKGDRGDVVTDLDLMAEQLVVARIREHFPHDRIVSEEAGTLPPSGAADAADPGRTWLVDPLDGSNNVAIGLPAYGVGIALCVDSAPVVGVVHDPVTDRTWTACAGAGAYGPAGRLAGPSRPLPAAGPLLAWTQGHAVRRTDPVARALRGALEERCRRLLQLWAPLLAWAMLARGDIDGFVGYRAEGIDLPAGLLLAAEAGVEVRALDGGPFHGGAAGPDTDRSFVAGRAEDLPFLLDLVGSACPVTALTG
ncbi:inositol monophosphatase [Streptomyces mashuensis]|uniref:Inositol monophosphatase n=1 Tax=Streptomyces mashuensis TaxID=33904 RepID=A0A919EFQ4_9ACTN|nr:inositol monophosphatase [Streptomyces mashuensis]GHF65173.1 inositol monophosphatase [Streptomyces mashuensis]